MSGKFYGEANDPAWHKKLSVMPLAELINYRQNTSNLLQRADPSRPGYEAFAAKLEERMLIMEHYIKQYNERTDARIENSKREKVNEVYSVFQNAKGIPKRKLDEIKGKLKSKYGIDVEAREDGHVFKDKTEEKKEPKKKKTKKIIITSDEESDSDKNFVVKTESLECKESINDFEGDWKK